MGKVITIVPRQSLARNQILFGTVCPREMAALRGELWTVTPMPVPPVLILLPLQELENVAR